MTLTVLQEQAAEMFRGGVITQQEHAELVGEMEHHSILRIQSRFRARKAKEAKQTKAVTQQSNAALRLQTKLRQRNARVEVQTRKSERTMAADQQFDILASLSPVPLKKVSDHICSNVQYSQEDLVRMREARKRKCKCAIQ
jgi:hypothetical protein